MTVIDTRRPPSAPNTKVAEFSSPLLQADDHHLCPGCGFHPVALRLILETLVELELTTRNICLLSHGCSGTFVNTLDVDLTLPLHGRGPANATGMKRMLPDRVIWTLQGDGDMVSEGLAEILHTAARGENITCFLLNNGVFGDTGGQMTAATVVGQKTKNTLEGRDASYHGYPISICDILKTMPGVAYVARGSVYNAAGIVQAKKMIHKAFQHQLSGDGLSIVELLTMCPTGWFVSASGGPEYLEKTLEKAYPLGELKDVQSAAQVR